MFTVRDVDAAVDASVQARVSFCVLLLLFNTLKVISSSCLM